MTTGIARFASVTSVKASRRRRALLASVLAVPAVAAFGQSAAFGQTLYWDGNGAAAGAGAAPAGTWGADPFWNDQADGEAAGTIGAWVDGSTAVFAAGTDAVGPYTVTVTGTQTAAGLTFEEGSVGLFGSGTIALNPGATVHTAAGTTATIGVTTGGVASGAFVAGTGLTKTGGGTLVLGNDNNPFNGKLVITGGTLAMNGEKSGAAGATSSSGVIPAAVTPDYVTLSNNATLQSTRAGIGVTFLATNKGITLGAGGGTLAVSDTTAGNLNIYSGVITGTGPLTYSGPGILSLVGTHTYTGGTNVTGGILRLRTNSNLIPNASLVTVTTPGTFDMATLSDTVAGIAGNGTVAASATSAATLTLSVASTATFSGTISTLAGAATTLKLTKTGNGVQVLSGTNMNTGVITVSAGALQFNTPASIGGTGATVTANANAAAAAGYAIDQDFLGRIVNTSVGSAALAANSANDLNFTGYAALSLGGANGSHTYSGTLTPDGSTYRLGGGRGTLVFASPLTGARDLSVTNTGTVALTSDANDYTGSTTIGAGAILAIGDGGTTGVLPGTAVTDDGTLRVNRSDNYTLTHLVSGTGGISKTGTGTLHISAANTYTGNVSVTGGSLVVDHLADLGGPPATGNKTLTASGAQLHLDGAAGDLSLPANYVVVSSGVTLFNDAGNNTIAGTITLASGFGDSTITSNGGSLTLAGEIFPNTTIRNLRLDGTAGGLVTGVIRDGSATNKLVSVIKQGAGTWTLGAANTHTGATVVNAGTLKIGVSDAIPTTSAVTVNGGTLDLNGFAQTIPSLAGTGGSVLVSGALTVNGSASTSFGGTLSGSAAFTKSGAGSQTVGSVDLDSVTLTGGTLAVAPASPKARVGTLSVTGSKLDVTDNRVVLTATSAADFRNLLLSGRAADGSGIGQWTGDGVVSSNAAADAGKLAAIGYLLAGDAGLVGSSWGGVTGLAAGNVITRVTLYGDINLTGAVDRDDIALIDKGFALYSAGGIAAGTATWINGDVTYDGIVDAADFVQLDRVLAANGLLSPVLLATHEAQFGAGFAQQVMAAVPEPTSLGLLSAGAVGLFGRRRRTR
jgi:autotransporter-associated beta strand protein